MALGVAGNAIAFGGVVDCPVAKGLGTAVIICPHRSHGNGVGVGGRIGKSGSAAVLVEAVAGSGSDDDVMVSEAGEFVTDAVEGLGIAPVLSFS